MKDTWRIGSYIRILRQRLGFTRRDMARRIAVDAPELLDYELDRRGIGIGPLLRLAVMAYSAGELEIARSLMIRVSHQARIDPVALAECAHSIIEEVSA